MPYSYTNNIILSVPYLALPHHIGSCRSVAERVENVPHQIGIVEIQSNLLWIVLQIGLYQIYHSVVDSHLCQQRNQPHSKFPEQ